MPAKSLQQVVELSKRRGFVFPGSEIYGGFGNSYTFGHYGTQLKNNIRDLWWRQFVTGRGDIFGLDSGILMPPTVWQASGHTEGFNDLLIEDTETKERFRADHLLEKEHGVDVEGWEVEKINEFLKEHPVHNPVTKKKLAGGVKQFNLMFEVMMGKTGEEKSTWLRPETAQGIFVSVKNMLDAKRMQLPFGIAQVGKAFRNEITPGQFLFRQLEFEQMEIEYFCKEEQWQQVFDEWLACMDEFCAALGLPKDMCHHAEHAQEKLSHYSRRTVDIEFDFPFGRKELFGLAYRTDFDLKAHQEATKEKLAYTDTETGESYIPHCIEPTFGLTRAVLAVLCAAFHEEKVGEETRTVLQLPTHLAPVTAAVLPLSKKEGLIKKAESISDMLRKKGVAVECDHNQSIGKRYRRHDEIGTPFAITVDFGTIGEEDTQCKKDCVTVRERDTMASEEMPIEKAIEKMALVKG